MSNVTYLEVRKEPPLPEELRKALDEIVRLAVEQNSIEARRELILAMAAVFPDDTDSE